VNILLLGHARHGKDSVAHIWEAIGLRCIGSSEAALELFVFEQLRDKKGYLTPAECFNDRVNHRQEWFDLIVEFNKGNRARLAQHIFGMADVYVGMRSQLEFEATMAYITPIVAWVDRSQHLPPDPTMEIQKPANAITIDNNGTLHDLQRNAAEAYRTIKGMA